MAAASTKRYQDFCGLNPDFKLDFEPLDGDDARWRKEVLILEKFNLRLKLVSKSSTTQTTAANLMSLILGYADGIVFDFAETDTKRLKYHKRLIECVEKLGKATVFINAK